LVDLFKTARSESDNLRHFGGVKEGTGTQRPCGGGTLTNDPENEVTATMSKKGRKGDLRGKGSVKLHTRRFFLAGARIEVGGGKGKKGKTTKMWVLRAV